MKRQVTNSIPISKEEIRKKLEKQIRYGDLAEKAKYAMDMYEYHLAQHLFYLNQLNHIQSYPDTIIPSHEGVYISTLPLMCVNDKSNVSTDTAVPNTVATNQYNTIIIESKNKPVPDFTANPHQKESAFHPPPAPKKKIVSTRVNEPGGEARKNLNNIFNTM